MAWPLIAAAGIGAAGTVASSVIGAKGAQSAGEDAKNMQKRVYNKSRKWRDAGKNALKEYMKMLEAGPGEFDPEQDPGYLYGYKRTVEDPITRQASVRSRLFDPSTQLALGRAAQDYATTKYDNWLNRYYTAMQPYWNMSEAGRLTTLQAGSQAAAMQPLVQNAQMEGTNALLAGVNSLSNIGNNALNAYMTSQLLKPKPDYQNWLATHANVGR